MGKYAIVVTDKDAIEAVDPNGAPWTVGDVFSFGEYETVPTEALSDHGLVAVAIDHFPEFNETWDRDTQSIISRDLNRPDPNGLMLAVFADPPNGLGRQKARAMARDYGDVTLALQHENYSLVRAAVEDMLADDFIDQSEYDVLQGLMENFNIPNE